MAENEKEQEQILERMKELLAEIGVQYDDLNQANKDLDKTLEGVVNRLAEKAKLQQKEVETLKVLEEYYKSAGDDNEEILEKIEKRLEFYKLEIEQNKLLSKFQLQKLRAYQDMLSPMTKARQIQEEMSKLSEKDKKTYLIGSLLQQSEKLTNFFMSIVKTYSQIKAELNQITTDSDSYLKNVREVAELVPGLAPTEAASSLKVLTKEFSNFTKLTEAQRTRILAITATMDKLGLSATNVSITMETMTKSLGYSRSQSIQFLSSLVDFSKKTNIPMAELDRNMSAVGSHLVKFGKENYDKVFLSLSVAAKNLGVEIGKLISITEGFTTFEGAAMAAGQLNAALGGNFINSINLLDASLRNPIEAFQQIKEAMDASGKSFGDLSPAMQRYVASILNMELADAQRLFSQSLGAASAELNTRSLKEKELQELAAKSTDVFKRLEIVLQKIATSPIVDFIISVIEKLALVIEYITSIPYLGEGIGVLVGTFALLYSSIVMINAVMATYGKFMGAISAMRTGEITKLGSQASAQQILNTKQAEGVVISEAAGASMAALGPTLALVGLGVGVAAVGFSLLADSIKTLDENGRHTIVILAGIAAGVAIAAIVMLKAAPAITLTTGLLIGLGVAVGVVIAAMAVLSYMKEKQIKQEVELQKAKNESLKLIKEISSLDQISANLFFESLISNITRLAEVINDNKEELMMLKELGSIKLPETSMPKRQSEDSSSSSFAKESTKEVTLVINSPVTLDGAPFGKMIYNGIALWKEMETREIRPGSLAFDNGALAR